MEIWEKYVHWARTISEEQHKKKIRSDPREEEMSMLKEKEQHSNPTFLPGFSQLSFVAFLIACKF